jgi:hypothetical protein
MVVGGQRDALAALPAIKTRYPLYRKLRGPQNHVHSCKNLAPTGIQTPKVQPIGRRYTDWANPAPTKRCLRQ